MVLRQHLSPCPSTAYDPKLLQLSHVAGRCGSSRASISSRCLQVQARMKDVYNGGSDKLSHAEKSATRQVDEKCASTVLCDCGTRYTTCPFLLAGGSSRQTADSAAASVQTQPTVDVKQIASHTSWQDHLPLSFIQLIRPIQRGLQPPYARIQRRRV